MRMTIIYLFYVGVRYPGTGGERERIGTKDKRKQFELYSLSIVER